METVTPLLYKVRSETYLKEFSVQLMHVKKYLCYVVNFNKVIKSLTKTYCGTFICQHRDWQPVNRTSLTSITHQLKSLSVLNFPQGYILLVKCYHLRGTVVWLSLQTKARIWWHITPHIYFVVFLYSTTQLYVSKFRIISTYYNYVSFA